MTSIFQPRRFHVLLLLAVVKDAHWIKLDYESQRAGQKFLTFGEARRRF